MRNGYKSQAKGLWQNLILPWHLLYMAMENVKSRVH